MYDDPRIDVSLESYPIVPLPGGFKRRVMVNIEAQRLTIRLSFLDLVLPAFFTFFLAVFVATSAWVYTILDPLWMPRLIWYLQFTWLQVKSVLYLPVIGMGVFVLFGSLLGLLLLVFWIFSPRLIFLQSRN